MFVQQSTTTPLPILLISSSDHITGLTGATPTVTISKNGGAFASPGGSVTEIANGWYKYTPTTTDTATLGALAIHATATGADPTDLLYQTVAFNPNDPAAGVWNVIASTYTSSANMGGVLEAIASALGMLNLLPVSLLPTQPSYTVLPEQAIAVTIVQGDDYTTEVGALTFSSANWITLTGGGTTVKLTVRTADVAETLLLQVTGSVTSGSGIQTVTFQPTHTQTSTMPVATHNFAIQATLVDGAERTLAIGTFTVLDGITNS